MSRDAAVYALLGKACFMEGQYKQAVANLEKAVGQDSLNSDYYDWLGRAYGRLAEGSSFPVGTRICQEDGPCF